MSKHSKIYQKRFGAMIVMCEVCGEKQANDIHHIEARGMGGDPQGKKDKIENLIALCRECHDRAEGKVKPVLTKEELRKIHLNNL